MRFRNIVFTCNNYTEQQCDEIFNLDIWRYVVIGKEIGESGTPHLQGYGVFHNQMRHKKVHDMLKGCHVESRKGSHLQASEYCKKDGDYVEKGDAPQQGKRSDLEEVAEKIKKGISVKEIASEHTTTYIKYGRGIKDAILQLQTSYDHCSVRGIWIYGAPGS